MTLKFVKMNGAGNDFVVIDGRQARVRWERELVARLCDRHRGVGADGLLVLETSEGSGADFRMRYFNSDGGEAEMCGNGARCFARFASGLLGGAGEIGFETLAGRATAKVLKDGSVELAMMKPEVVGQAEELTLERGEGSTIKCVFWFLNTGVPHAVIFVDSAEELERLDVAGLGRAVRFHERFAPAGTNVNFVTVLDSNRLRVRTYERGVEAETLACGTGVTACALAHHLRAGCGSPVNVETRGGDVLGVRFEASGCEFTQVFLRGPAEFVFRGEIEVPEEAVWGGEATAMN